MYHSYSTYLTPCKASMFPRINKKNRIVHLVGSHIKKMLFHLHMTFHLGSSKMVLEMKLAKLTHGKIH